VYIAAVKPSRFLLAIAVLTLSLRASDERSVTVKSNLVENGLLRAMADVQGKPTELDCEISLSSCSQPQPGEYSMRPATADEGIYEDCTNVVLLKSSGITKEKIGVYCWLNNDSYIASRAAVQVQPVPATLPDKLSQPKQSQAQTSANGVTVSEPGIYDLSGLFKHADAVALVRIVSGDTEAYSTAVYKAAVVKGFKGAADGEIVYFGPYVGERIGWEYIVFLRNISKPIKPKAAQNAGYGTIRYAEVFNEGYSSIETSYECVFDGSEPAQKCDYGVRVCTDYIKLPSATPTFPPVSEETPFGCRAVRKTAFISLLEALSSPRK